MGKSIIIKGADFSSVAAGTSRLYILGLNFNNVTSNTVATSTTVINFFYQPSYCYDMLHKGVISGVRVKTSVAGNIGIIKCDGMLLDKSQGESLTETITLVDTIAITEDVQDYLLTAPITLAEGEILGFRYLGSSADRGNIKNFASGTAPMERIYTTGSSWAVSTSSVFGMDFF